MQFLVAMGCGQRARRGAALGRSGDDGGDGAIGQDALELDRVDLRAEPWPGNVGDQEIHTLWGSLTSHEAGRGARPSAVGTDH